MRTRKKEERREPRRSRGFIYQGDVKFDVVVVCHPPYEQLLERCLGAVDRSPLVASKTVVGDGFTPSARAGWSVLSGAWGSPNPARNLGARQGRARYIVFIDADDEIPDGYLARLADTIGTAPANTGVVYPVVSRSRQPSERETGEVTAYDYQKLRHYNYITTCSAWLRRAFESVGGFREELPRLDDWNLAMRVTAAGWTAAPCPAVYTATMHELGHRSQDPRTMEGVWQTRSMAVLTFLAGRRSLLAGWRDTLLSLDLPPVKALYVANTSDDAGFNMELQEVLEALGRKFGKIVLLRLPGWGQTEDRNDRGRNAHVGWLYTQGVRHITEDMTLTIEDDEIVPPDAARQLSRHFRMSHTCGAAAAVYESAKRPGKVCGSLSNDWSRRPDFPGFRDVAEAGIVPSGCTLYPTQVLQKCLPATAQFEEEGVHLGWDGALSAAIRLDGWTLLLDGMVQCEHRFRHE